MHVCTVTGANYSRPNSPYLKSTNNVQRQLVDQSERRIIDCRAYEKLKALKNLVKIAIVLHVSYNFILHP